MFVCLFVCLIVFGFVCSCLFVCFGWLIVVVGLFYVFLCFVVCCLLFVVDGRWSVVGSAAVAAVAVVPQLHATVHSHGTFSGYVTELH